MLSKETFSAFMLTNKLLLLIFSFVFFTLSLKAENTKNVDWVLVEGESKTLHIGDLPLITVNHPDLVNVKGNGNYQVKIQALKQGHTQLHFHGGQSDAIIVSLQITSQERYKQYKEIQQQLLNIHNLTINISQDDIVLEGNLLLPRDLKQVKQVKISYSNIIDLTTFNKNIYQKVTAKYLQHKLNTPTISVDVKENFLILDGFTTNKEEIVKLGKKALMLAHINNPDMQLKNMIEVKKTVINIHLTFMQINTNDIDQQGFNILETFKSVGSLKWDGPGTASSGLAIGAEARINALVEKAWADVLATPRINVNSGQEGEFHEGDSLIIQGTEVSKTTQVDTGIIVKATPTLHSNGDIDLAISFEASAPTVGPQGSIQVTKFYTKTFVTCTLGQSIILSELLTSIKRKFEKKTPLLGSIPILKLLFSNENKHKAKKDLVLLITPKVPSFSKDLIKADYRFQSLREMLRD